MSMHYAFCPTCGTRRIAYDYSCSVCSGLVRRVPTAVRTRTDSARALLSWPTVERSQSASPERQPVAA